MIRKGLETTLQKRNFNILFGPLVLWLANLAYWSWFSEEP